RPPPSRGSPDAPEHGGTANGVRNSPERTGDTSARRLRPPVRRSLRRRPAPRPVAARGPPRGLLRVPHRASPGAGGVTLAADPTVRRRPRARRATPYRGPGRLRDARPPVRRPHARGRSAAGRHGGRRSRRGPGSLPRGLSCHRHVRRGGATVDMAPSHPPPRRTHEPPPPPTP